MKMFLRIALAAALAAVVSTPVARAASDPLDSWARRSAPGLTNLLSVTYGNGLFVAVGDVSTVATSADGVSWTWGSIGSYGRLKRVRYLNGQFIALGESDKILFSTDAATWTEGTLPSANSWDIAYGNGKYVIAGGNTIVSSNAVNWTLMTPTIGGPPPFGKSYTLDAVAFGNDRFLGIPGGFGSPPSPPPLPSFYFTNGSGWIVGGAGPNSSGASSGDLIFANGRFVAAPSFVDNSIYNSTDGTGWGSFGVPGISPTVSGGLAFGQGNFVWAVYHSFSSPATPRIYTATDGMTWQQRTQAGAGDPTFDGKPRDGTYGAGSFVFVGDGGYIIQSGNLSGVPLITVQPQDRAAVVDNPVTFNAQAVGEPPLAYQWFFNSNSIAGATSNVLSFAHVGTTNMGFYHLIVSNSFGYATSRVASLGVSFLDIASYAGIKILGVPGKTYRIEATPSTGTPSWQTLTNLVLPQSPYIWIDYTSPTNAVRLYRAAEL